MKPAKNIEKYDGDWLLQLFDKHPQKRKKQLGQYLCHYFGIQPSYAGGLITRMLKNEREIKASEVGAILNFFETPNPLNHTKDAGFDTVLVEFIGDDETDSKDWELPKSLFGAANIPEKLCAIKAKGDGMMGEINDGDFVIYDPNDTKPSPSGIFVISDGIGLIVGNIKISVGSNPIMAKISFANKKYDHADAPLSKIAIKGRVVLKICGI